MKPIFRSSMFGFQKSDVVRFIAKQSSMHDAKVAELNEEIDKLRREHEAEVEELLQDRAALQALQDDQLKRIDSVLQMRKLLEEVDVQQDVLLNAAREGKESVSLMVSELLNMKKSLEIAEGYREKAEKFDQLATVLSGIVGSGEVSQEKPATVGSITLDVDTEKANLKMDEQENAVRAIGEKLDKIRQLVEIISL